MQGFFVCLMSEEKSPQVRCQHAQCRCQNDQNNEQLKKREGMSRLFV